MRVTEVTNIVAAEIVEERHRQYEKFGDENPLTTGPDSVRVPVLGEEFGEVCREVIESELRDIGLGNPGGDEKLYKELVQTAAVAAAWAEVVYYRLNSTQ